ncbi:MAG: hypothetical protein IPK73_03205 [Candidatus Obscuribacter sp.]|nr:hypothetical protein [Candidatus Obscuribacter sp.]MBK9281210.1 hypothetical protein [Candidatus Obscuribacter sp.]
MTQSLDISSLPLARISELAEFLDVSAANAEAIFRKLERAGDGFLPEDVDGSENNQSGNAEGVGRVSRLAQTLAAEVEKVYRREMDKLTACASTLERWRKSSPSATEAGEIERLGWELTQLQSKYLKVIEFASRLSSAKL